MFFPKRQKWNFNDNTLHCSILENLGMLDPHAECTHKAKTVDNLTSTFTRYLVKTETPTDVEKTRTRALKKSECGVCREFCGTFGLLKFFKTKGTKGGRVALVFVCWPFASFKTYMYYIVLMYTLSIHIPLASADRAGWRASANLQFRSSAVASERDPVFWRSSVSSGSLVYLQAY